MVSSEDAIGVPPLEVVIVTYRSAHLITNCLSSVERFAPTGTVTYVIDNASPDDTAGVVRCGFPSVRLVERGDNAGFSVANNVALRQVTAPYVLVLNPDAELAEGVVQHLLAEMERSPGIGVIGCRLLKTDGTSDHAAKRFIPTPLEAAHYFLGRLIGKRASRYAAPDVGDLDLADVDAINGAFMLVRKSAMDEVGLFDESYWMYAEDLDWCTRFREAGWRVVYDGRVTAFHIKGGVAGVRSLRLNYEFHRSMALYYRKHSHSQGVVVALVTLAIWIKFGVTAVSDGIRRAVAKVAP